MYRFASSSWKSSEATIFDILKFKAALSYMEDSHPFGEDFGPASNRDECIASSSALFWKLLQLTPDAPKLSFEILSLVLIEDDGAIEPGKRKALRRLFQPDANDELPLLSFVQSCDAVYKKYRYFRAAIKNASVIDKVLEGRFQ